MRISCFDDGPTPSRGGVEGGVLLIKLLMDEEWRVELFRYLLLHSLIDSPRLLFQCLLDTYRDPTYTSEGGIKTSQQQTSSRQPPAYLSSFACVP